MLRNGVVLTDPQGKKYRTLCVYDENANLIGFIMEELGEQLRENLELALQSQILVEPEPAAVDDEIEMPEDVPMVTMSDMKLQQLEEELDGVGDFADDPFVTEIDDEDEE